MNRTDRLLAIVLELQGKGKQRAEDLAATFEVSKRTIYRDIEALSEAGVPVAAAPGQGYRLVEGYFLPPLSFTAEEAIMLILGSRVMSGSFDAQYRAAAEAASRKITGVLPPSLREEVAYLQSSIRFITPEDRSRSAPATLLQTVRGAIIDRRRLRFRYYARYRRDAHAASGPDLEWREVDPYGLANVSATWYLTAFDHARRDVRNFRLERIEELSVLEETFSRPAGFSIGQRMPDDFTVTVRALFSEEVSRWVQEAPSFFTVGEEAVEGGLLVTLRVRHEREVVQWLLGWGRHVRVLEPESLVALLVEEAEETKNQYKRTQNP